MQKITTQSLLTGLALTTLLTTFGCNLFPNVKRDTPPPPPANQANGPTAEALVTYLNANARLVQSFQAEAVDIDARQGNQPIGLTGLLACQKPRDFRLKAKLAGRQFVDIGSNNDEFWFWVNAKDAQGENYVYHCKHSELAQAGQVLPIPFQPEMVLAALGVAEFDPAKTYERKVNTDTIELIERIKSPQGKDQLKVVVFNRAKATHNKPQVAAYILKDAETGKDICQANVESVQQLATGAIIPYRVELVWPAENVKMRLTLGGVKARTYSPQESAKLFSRQELGNLLSFDLAARKPDAPGGLGQAEEIQRTGVQPR